MDLAKKLCFKHGHDQEQFGPLRTKLRQVARLLLEFRLVSKIKDASLLDLFFPPRFCIVLAAVRSLSGFDDETHTYMKPSLAIKIGHTLKKVAMMLVSQALIEGNTTKETEARSVHTLLTENWDVEVSSHALRTIYQGKRNNPKLLPLTSDVVLLTKYLKEESENSMNDISAAISPEEVQNAWKKLSNVVLTQLMLFNRKRQGEISKLSVADYSNIKKGSSHVLDAQALSKFEQDLVKVMWRVEIVGKRGRTVPVLITEEMKKVLDELVKLRSDVGVSSSNQFVFAVLEGSNHHIRGCDSLRTLSSLSGAQRPDLLRSTQSCIQVAKVSKLLVALEGNSGDPGTLLQGRNLDELELNQDEEIQENQIDESEEESEETEEQNDLLQAKQTETGTKHPLVSDESMTIRKKFKESPLTKKPINSKQQCPLDPKKYLGQKKNRLQLSVTWVTS
ncbi:hypothetical protein BSL78_24110 [Apostichopus japonicus]|uniref:Uncharacterized protein n=1 Tax=Stichopus japonicus TaxID=307972 RepID=A0A2G8JTG9_STIJA|nr:hypothetical protein BSL78_24110 [Apostichopus japonicus]